MTVDVTGERDNVLANLPGEMLGLSDTVCRVMSSVVAMQDLRARSLALASVTRMILRKEMREESRAELIGQPHEKINQFRIVSFVARALGLY